MNTAMMHACSLIKEVRAGRPRLEAADSRNLKFVALLDVPHPPIIILVRRCGKPSAYHYPKQQRLRVISQLDRHELPFPRFLAELDSLPREVVPRVILGARWS